MPAKPAFPAEKAARQVVTRSPNRAVGLINCPWFQNQPIQHESRLEKHFVYRAMLFPGLSHIQHQPFRLKLAGDRKSYTPDFLLSFANGEAVVVEIKRSEKVKATLKRFDEIAELLATRHLKFFVIHEGQIEGSFRDQSALLIRRYAMLSVPGELINHAVEFVAGHPNGVAIGKLKTAVDISEMQFFHLIARRHIAIGANVGLSSDDLVHPISKEHANVDHQFGSWFGAAQWRSHH